MVETVAQLRVDEGLASISLRAGVAETWLRRGEATEVRSAGQRMEPARRILSRGCAAPVRLFLLDRHAGHYVEQPRLGRVLEHGGQRIDSGDLVLRVVECPCEVECACPPHWESQIGGDIHALSPGVQAVGEVLDAADVGDAIALQNRQRGVVVEGRAEQDTAVDLDVEVVGGHRHVAPRRVGKPAAEVHRSLRSQRLRAEHPRDGIPHGKDAGLRRHSADDVGDHLTEVLLTEPRGAEPRARSPAQRESLPGLVSQRQLPCHPLTDVAVGLKPSSHVGQELLRHLRFRVGVHREVGPVVVRGVGRREAREALRAGDGAAPELRGVPAVDIRCWLPLNDLIALAAERGAHREVDGRRQSHVQ